MRTNRSPLGAALLVAGGLALLAGCGGSSDSGDGEATTTTAAETATTSIPGPTVTSEPPASTATSAPTTATSAPPTTVPLLVPGQPCAPGSDPDCIDPFADGQYVYLVGGAACMASPVGGPSCADLDGDGRAGYPDSG